jgi:peptide deformylase
MALRNLRYDGDEILRKTAKQVTDITKKIEILIQDMTDTMNHYDGAGLAAP